MLVRIRFSKTGPIKFIGHLDIMRYFQKAVSRSGLSIRFTQGFHPHPVMTFAAPLGVGITSDGEYMDFELLDTLTPDEILARFNQVLTGGIRVTKVSILDPREQNVKKQSIMALVDTSDYLIFPKPETRVEKQAFQDACHLVLSQKEIILTKKTKNSEKELDIKPYLYSHAFSFSDFMQKHSLTQEQKEQISCSVPEQEALPYLYLSLAAGSAMNIRPELILEAILLQGGFSLSTAGFQVHRIECYNNSEEGCVPLWAIK